MAMVREAMWALMFDSRVFDAAWTALKVSSMPFVVAVGACGTVSSMLDASSGCPVIRGVEVWSVAPGSVMFEACLEEPDSRDDLRTALRPTGCQFQNNIRTRESYHAERRIVLESSCRIVLVAKCSNLKG